MTNSPINTHQNNIDHLNEVSFDDIRPLKDGEVKAAIESLLTDEKFKRAVTPIISPIPWDMFSEKLRRYNTVYDFQENVIYTLITKFIEGNIDNNGKFDRIKLALTLFDFEDELMIKYTEEITTTA